VALHRAFGSATGEGGGGEAAKAVPAVVTDQPCFFDAAGDDHVGGLRGQPGRSGSIAVAVDRSAGGAGVEGVGGEALRQRTNAVTASRGPADVVPVMATVQPAPA